MTATSQARTFAIVASQRTGSTNLVRSLDAEPNIFCAGELFHGGPHVLHAKFSYPRESWIRGLFRPFAPHAWEQRRVRRHIEYFFRIAGTGVQAVGFKVMASQLRQNKAILPALSTLGAALLFLYRRDSFATALSYARAKISRVYHSDRADHAHTAGAIRIEPADFRRFLARCKADQSAIMAMHQTYGGTLLAYEDMSDQWDTFCETVGRAIGVRELKLTPALDRLSASYLAVGIVNEDALRREFAESDTSSVAAGTP